MNTSARYRSMEESCRRHAQLDDATARSWLEEAELLSKLIKVEQRLQVLRNRIRRPSRLAAISSNSSKSQAAQKLKP
jgi:hypothetical protein